MVYPNESYKVIPGGRSSCKSLAFANASDAGRQALLTRITLMGTERTARVARLVCAPAGRSRCLRLRHRRLQVCGRTGPTADDCVKHRWVIETVIAGRCAISRCSECGSQRTERI